jgi:uncharacterized protein (DUF433 family)
MKGVLKKFSKTCIAENINCGCRLQMDSSTRVLELPIASVSRYDLNMTTELRTAGAAPSPGGHIAIIPGVCGGKPHVIGHRIKVQHIAVWHEKMGLSADEIVSQQPGLTLADVYAALAYYWDHREEIEADIKAGREFAEQLRGGAASIFDKARQMNGPDDSLPSG